MSAKVRGPLHKNGFKDRQGPEHPESSEAADLNEMLRGDKDDWLWAYSDEPELDPTRPPDVELLSE